MHTLYDSESFIVTFTVTATQPQEPARMGAAELPALLRQGFEIVDKRSGKELYLDGSWAELFQQQLTAWQLHAPTQDEVEDTLAQYAELANIPLHVH